MTPGLLLEGGFVLQFSVPGKARSSGSKRAFWKAGMARPRIVEDDEKAAAWKDRVALVAAQKMAGRPLLDGHLFLVIEFVRVRPAGHTKADGTLSKAGREEPWPRTKPDTLKLARALEDALIGVVYTDDARISYHELRKAWGPREEALVTVGERMTWNTPSPPTWAHGHREDSLGPETEGGLPALPDPGPLT